MVIKRPFNTLLRFPKKGGGYYQTSSHLFSGVSLLKTNKKNTDFTFNSSYCFCKISCNYSFRFFLLLVHSAKPAKGKVAFAKTVICIAQPFFFFCIFSVHPSVNILKPPDDIYRIYHGEELALVCRGEGDPEPTISWKREVSNAVFFPLSIINKVSYKTHWTYQL